MITRRLTHVCLPILLFVTLACGLPVSVGQPSSDAPAAADTDAPQSVDSGAVPTAASSAATPALVTTVMASAHVATPGEPPASSALNYDVDSSGTGAEHRAPYGDSYNINLFERPFTRQEMDYIPPLDILTFQISGDPTWFYVSFDLVGGDLNDPLNLNYGVELDTDHDGYGDYLVWAQPPYTPKWLAETILVYQDTNHGTGGSSAEKSDAVYPGAGYDKLIFDRGQGEDTDLAWVRANPQLSTAVQFAFKRSLAGGAFMWGVWADAGLRDPSAFDYNDRFTEPEAGSPEKSEQYYPIREIYQVDNTCWPAYGFKPLGFEPHLCPSLEPQPTKHKVTPTPGCTSILSCYDNPGDLVIPPPPVVPPVP